MKNNAARPVKYAKANNSGNSSWASRNMIISGAFILIYLFIHLLDFWFPTISKNYLGTVATETDFQHLQEKFATLWRVALYVVAFILLGLHLAHGFQSSFQSIGARHPKYLKCINTLGTWYSILIPLGFIAVAIFHFVTQ